jgi:hypothetical protein
MLEMSSNRENLMKVVQLQVDGREQALKKKRLVGSVIHAGNVS